MNTDRIEIEVDEAMLGNTFDDVDGDGLDSFCAELQTLLDDQHANIEIVQIRTSYNGARITYDDDGNQIDIPDDAWERAQELIAPRYWSGSHENTAWHAKYDDALEIDDD